MVGCNVGCILRQQWVQSDVTNANVGNYNVNTTYPYVFGNRGRTIIVKDSYGQADPDAYPTHEPWSVTPAHKESAWDANESGFNTVGESFQVANTNAVGKDGSSATMTWYEASGTTDATYNSAGYSACAQYSEAADQSDKGTWRLPTIRELKLIYAQGGKLVSNLYSLGYYWSATEESTTSTAVKVVYFQSGGNVTSSAKQANTNYRVCCVRDTKIALTKSDYPKIVNGNTIVVEDLVGRADPTEYPVHNKWTVTPLHSWHPNVNFSTASLNSYGRKYQIAKANALGKDRSSETMNWYEATGTSHEIYNSSGYSACAQYSEAADQSDKGTWRLPTLKELSLCQLFIVRAESVQLSYRPFPNIPSGIKCWTATDYPGTGYGVGGYRVGFGIGGNTVSESKDNTFYVRCVRDI